MSLTAAFLRKSMLFYIALPLMIFAAGFLRWYWALPVCTALLFGLFFACRPNFRPSLSDKLSIPLGRLIAFACIILLWTHLGGMNGLFFQSEDWHWRNAIFHDLVDMEWPVIYAEKDSALVYYIGFWLPPALAAKAVGWLTGSAVLAWRTARFALWLWSSLGLFLTALMLMLFVHAAKGWQQWLALAVFMFFSGMDVLGAVWADTIDRVFEPEVLHLEWWTLDGKQYSSITTCLYWVFNQSIIPWMVTLLFLAEKDARNYLLLGMACLCCGPLPFVGLVVCMGAQWLTALVRNLKEKRPSDSLKAAFSPANCLLLLLIFPVLGAYYLGNAAFGGTAAPIEGLSLLEKLDAYVSRSFAVFFLADAGVYLALLWNRKMKSPLFYVVAFSLLFIPYFHIGYSEDFCLRASIPGIFILMVWCAERLTEELPKFRLLHPVRKALLACLIAALLTGALTPATEIYRGIYHAAAQKTIRLSKDAFGSIGVLDDAQNFTANDYRNTFFFRYMARTDA